MITDPIPPDFMTGELMPPESIPGAMLESIDDEHCIEVEYPVILAPIREYHRYKVLYGGRGGGKSHTIAIELLLRGVKDPLRILCAREVQKSIKQSVHQLLSDYIQKLELSAFYEILDTEIRGCNGTVFNFAGLAGNTVDGLKSYEGADICWVEEAQTVSSRSWQILTPTIRKEGSMIWISFNPFMELDPTYLRFVVNPPAGAWVQRVNWSDNPWFSDELEKERQHCMIADPDNYANIWEGECKGASDMQFITTPSVRESMERSPIYNGTDPLICGVDLARGGGDDCFIVFRRGRDCKSERVYKIGGEASRNSMRVVALLVQLFRDHRPDQINADEGSMGGPIVDRLNQLNWQVTGISFGSRALDQKHWANRGTEMWAKMREWINTGGALPKDERLVSELTCREFGHDNKDRVILESKKKMKADGKPSPDFADAVALTFAVEVASIERGHKDDIPGLRHNDTHDYDPLDAL